MQLSFDEEQFGWCQNSLPDEQKLEVEVKTGKRFDCGQPPQGEPVLRRPFSRTVSFSTRRLRQSSISPCSDAPEGGIEQLERRVSLDGLVSIGGNYYSPAIGERRRRRGKSS